MLVKWSQWYLKFWFTQKYIHIRRIRIFPIIEQKYLQWGKHMNGLRLDTGANRIGLYLLTRNCMYSCEIKNFAMCVRSSECTILKWTSRRSTCKINIEYLGNTCPERQRLTALRNRHSNNAKYSSLWHHSYLILFLDKQQK